MLLIIHLGLVFASMLGVIIHLGLVFAYAFSSVLLFVFLWLVSNRGSSGPSLIFLKPYFVRKLFLSPYVKFPLRVQISVAFNFLQAWASFYVT